METIDVKTTGVVHTLTYDDVNKDDDLEISLVGTSDEFELDPTTGMIYLHIFIFYLYLWDRGVRE